MRPQAVFNAAPETQRQMLQTLWRELYDALVSESPGAGMPPKGMPCFSVRHDKLPTDKKPVAVARLYRNGYPACAECIRLAVGRGTRPGGWPLRLLPPGKDE